MPNVKGLTPYFNPDYVSAIAWDGKRYFIADEWGYLGEEESKEPVQPPL
jgi:hypothetical protein